MTALNAHIERAARLMLAMSEIEREQSDPMKAAMRMLLIAVAADHFDALMARLGVGRPV